ncbi:MAG: 50S ribosomal protein L9 [Candidatus Aminicenantes bacterium]|nr:50S ribosomal protein L9 [Candidatus Aminicenantes bacterium]
MKVLLTEEVDKLGIVGDVVDVKAGYARNFLLPRGLALTVTPHNVALMERRKIKYLKELESLREKAQAQKEALEAVVLEFERKAGENGVLFGSVTTADIETYLAEKGFEVDRKRFHLPEAIKKVGEFTCLFKLHPEVTAELRVVVKPEGEMEPVAVAEEAEVVADEAKAESTEPDGIEDQSTDSDEEPEKDAGDVTGD